MLVALVVLVVIGAFVLGALVTWSIKGHIDAYIDNAAYAKAITHPEMLDDDGNIIHDELLFIRTQDDYEDLEDDED